jgi:uncharacterized protein (DUF2147 family)
MRNKNLIVVFLLFQFTVKSQNEVCGQWKTIDDHTGKVSSIVELFQKNDKLFGKVIKVIPAPGEVADPICTKCTDFRKNKKINGLLIVSGLSYKKGVWSSGKILDPDNGKEYDCKIWFEDGVVKVRGYIAFVYRTQEWLPYKP